MEKKKKDTQKYNSIPILLSDKEEMYHNVKWLTLDGRIMGGFILFFEVFSYFPLFVQ